MMGHLVFVKMFQFLLGMPMQGGRGMQQGPNTQMSGQMAPGNQMSGSGNQMGVPNQMSGPNMQMTGPNQMGGPNAQLGGPSQMGGPNAQMGGPNAQMGPNQMGGPNAQMGMPGQMGGPNAPMGGPNQMGGPNSQMGGTGQMGGPNTQMGGQPIRQQHFAPQQLHQLRAQIMAYKLLARNQPLPEQLKMSMEGKRMYPQQMSRQGTLSILKNLNTFLFLFLDKMGRHV